LESTSQLTLTADQKAPSNGAHDHSEATHDTPTPFVNRPAALAESAESPAEPGDRVSSILGKGQSLLSLEKPEEAVKCFDEALAIDPGNADAWVKKGTALERLKRLEEAIGCYDRAIATNPVMTLAYLYKGGICNQLERFTEALECYEQALRSQQKSAVH
jgi:tetratricopeptide (TPR) repeat protein